MVPRILSVNVGLPRTVQWKGKAVSTGIFKEPVRGPVALDTLNFAGDRQADLRVHGGPDKAVYVYPVEHYDYWRRELPGVELTWGSFAPSMLIFAGAMVIGVLLLLLLEVVRLVQWKSHQAV